MSNFTVPRYSNMIPIGVAKKQVQIVRRQTQAPQQAGQAGVVGTNSNHVSLNLVPKLLDSVLKSFPFYQVFYISASKLLASQQSVFTYPSDTCVDEETRYLVKEGLMKQIPWRTSWDQDEITIAIRDAFQGLGPEFEFAFARNGTSKAGSAFRPWPDVIHIINVRDFQHVK